MNKNNNNNKNNNKEKGRNVRNKMKKSDCMNSNEYIICQFGSVGTTIYIIVKVIGTYRAGCFEF